MERMVIRGGRRLSGAVRVSGAKNAALPIMAVAALFVVFRRRRRRRSHPVKAAEGGMPRLRQELSHQ